MLQFYNGVLFVFNSAFHCCDDSILIYMIFEIYSVSLEQWHYDNVILVFFFTVYIIQALKPRYVLWNVLAFLKRLPLLIIKWFLFGHFTSIDNNKGKSLTSFLMWFHGRFLYVCLSFRCNIYWNVFFV